MGKNDEKDQASVFDSREALEAGFKRIRAENRAREEVQAGQSEAAAEVTGNRFDFNDRLLVESALEDAENLIGVLRTALENGWPTDEGFPVVTNWIRLSKTRVPCLEGNIHGFLADGTVRLQTAPIILHDPVRGLVLTTDGWLRTEQPLVPPEDEDD